MDVCHQPTCAAKLAKVDECPSNNLIGFNSSLRFEYEAIIDKKLPANNADLNSDNCHDWVASEETSSEDATDVESPEKFSIDSPQHKYLNSFSFLKWSYLHANTAEMRSMSGQLAANRKEFVYVAEAMDIMQQIMMSDFTKFWKPTTFVSTYSVAKHMAIALNYRLSPLKLLTVAVRNFWFDNLELKIGKNGLHVDRHLFRHYMGFYRNYTNCCLELPCQKVELNMMVKLYNWIIRDDNELRLGKKILTMYNMANFLKVRYLLEHYWTMFSLRGKKRIREAEAFQVYLSTRQLLSSDVKSIFLSRISKCFLPLVASIEFITLNIHELIYILKLDIICVNSEDEVFFAAIRWLEFNWKERQKHLVELMAALRFHHLSPWLQYSIEFRPENHIIGQVGANQMVKAKLWQACLIAEANLAYDQYPQNSNDILFKRYRLMKEVERYWSYCKRVPHHHDINCPQFRRLTYGSFKRFLNGIHYRAHKLMASLKHIPQKHWNSYICCDQVLSRKNTDPFARNVIPYFYRLKRTKAMN